ncbi:pseudouridine synthase [Paraflavitalea devenefica]|uniref:pseudouridine synthase n=1 Tax=Paraflavitalea devenefica TaxID=2716334 RepID=UPI001FEC0E38|nr:pseudouridine synthase [Paraflavitalea devenefica]
MSKSSKAPFGKFIQQKETGAKKKERIRQEKKVQRQETKAYFDKKKEEARAFRQGNAANAAGAAPKTPKGGFPSAVGRKPKSADKQGTDDWQSGRDSMRENAKSGGKKFVNKGYNRMSYMERKKKQAERETQNPESRSQKPEARVQKPAFGKKQESKPAFTKTPANKPAYSKAPATKPATGNKTKLTISKPSQEPAKPAAGKASNVIPLNKFIAHAGITSRRDAADIVKSGLVVVNGKVITEPGFKVTAQDEVKVNGKQITIRKNMVYILINKPKDFITTTEDPQGRRTVLDIIKHATTERVYPIGRLDRNTTGVLLLTNDGELAQKLAHPSYMVKKIYEVKLDKPLIKKDFDTIANGVTLEDGFVAPDALAYADPKDKSVIGIEIHSGRNRIVRRIFEFMGYDVRNLDRVMYANLTKKNVDRGKWRFLSEKEVRLLKYLNTSYTKK